MIFDTSNKQGRILIIKNLCCAVLKENNKDVFTTIKAYKR